MATLNVDACPRCSHTLPPDSSHTQPCEQCQGVFVSRAAMRLILAALRDGRDLTVAMSPYRSAAYATEPVEREIRYLRCPRCDDLMNRTDLIAGAGIVVDMCMAHGVWFDNGELSHATAYVQRAGQTEGSDNTRGAAQAKIASALGRYFQL